MYGRENGKSVFSCSLVMTHLLTHSFVQPGDTGLLCEGLCQQQLDSSILYWLYLVGISKQSFIPSEEGLGCSEMIDKDVCVEGKYVY